MAGVAKAPKVPKVPKVLKVRKCQQKCYPLEPVLEDCVTNLDDVPRKPSQQWCGEGQKRSQGKGRGGLLSKLRDGYVKLMNDVASSADFSGASAMYGCSTGQQDFPCAARAAAAVRAAEEDEEVQHAAFMAGGAPPTLKRH